MPKMLRLCRGCGVEFEAMVAPTTLRRGHGHFCSTSCSTRFHRSGKRSNNWKGGRKHAASGHVLVYAPDDPHARPDGYALEHRLVMARHLGRALSREEVVHHVNGDPADNRIENLMVMTQSVHMSLHRRAQEASHARH